MWNESRLNDGTVISYRFEKEIFEIKCQSTNMNNIANPGLFAVCRDEGRNSRVYIGRFTQDAKESVIHKNYTCSYLELYNIKPGKIDFEVEDESGDVVLKSYVDEKSYVCNNMDDDISLVRARELLESLIDEESDYDKAERAARYASAISADYPEVALGCFTEYNWHCIKTVKEFFNLTSVKYLICERDFLCEYIKNGEWFFGRVDSRMFAVCVSSDCEQSPFSNALDCSVCAFSNKDGKYYHAVGIALLNDGQYFYRLKIHTENNN